MTSEELGQDLEHVEVLQKKFEEFQTDMAAHEERVNEVNQFAAKLIQVNREVLCFSQHRHINFLYLNINVMYRHYINFSRREVLIGSLISE